MPYIRIKSLEGKIKTDVHQKFGLSCVVFENNGDSYKGEWKDCLKHGFGFYRWEKKNVGYAGHWKNGKRHGKGTLYPLHGSDVYIYNGIWKNDKRSGSGINCYPDGGKYDGAWKKDKRHGKGKMKYKDGSIYDGNWSKDMRSGIGIMSYADGSVYSGAWKRDVKCGQGILTTDAKDIYEGVWENDMKHGKGTYFSHVYGSELNGIWQQNIPRCATFEITNPNGAMKLIDIPECTLKEPQDVIKNAREYYMKRIAEDSFEK